MNWLEQTFQDIRYAVRSLSRNPRFTVVAVLTLGCGIGVNTSVFGVVNAVLLIPLSYPHSERLIWLADFDGYFQQDTWGSRADYVVWRAEAKSFEQMTAYGNQDLAILSDGEATEERVASVGGDFWAMTAAQPALGRLFEDGDANQIVVSHDLVARRFGNEQEVIGRTLLVNGHPFTISGVLPENFRFLFPQQYSSGDERRPIDAYIPLPDASEQPGEPMTQERGPAPAWVSVIGKLRPGASIEQARAEMETIHARLAAEFPQPTRRARLTVAPLGEKLVSSARRALLVLLVAAGFVLLIAAANVGNLVLAQASKQRREIAIRSAIGAGPARLARQILTQSLALALLGGAAGLALAHWILGIVVRLGSDSVPRLGETEIDGRVVAFTFAVSFLTALLLGLGSSFSKSSHLVDGLKGDARLSSDGIGTRRLRGILVASELALALVLLTGAGLMLKSFWHMTERPTGFTPENILSMRIPLSGPRYESWPPKQTYIRDLLSRLEATPGVQAAGIDCGTVNTAVELEGVPSAWPDKPPVAAIRMVSPGYLRAMGTPLMRGRWPTTGEEFDVVLVNRTFAQKFGDDGDPIGKRIGGSFLRGIIVGVVADFKHSQLDADPRPEVYYPYELSPMIRSIRLVVRTAEPSVVAPSIRELVSNIDRTQPIHRFGTLESMLSDSIAPRTFNLALIGSFSITAVLMALVGVYGLMAYTVEQRTREVGIRMALGARREEVVRMIVRQGMAVVLAGTVAGLAGALALTRLMDSLLYGVEANDPMTFATVAIVLSATALLACWRPAVRAARIDPVTALRHE